MNEWIKDDTNNEIERKEKFEKAIELIKKELKIMAPLAQAFYANVKAGNAQVNVNDIVKILEAQKK